MKIGIRYCGGCNPRYDRNREVEKLKAKFPETEFVHADDPNSILCILVCGCPSACLTDEGLYGKEILRTSQRKDFVKAGEQIKQLLEEVTKPEQNSVKKHIGVGETATLEKRFSEKDLQMFAELSMDRNPVHTDEIFATKSVFRKPIVHGVLVAALLSSVMGSELPGPGTILLEENVKFLHPVYPGELICAEIILAGYEEHRRHFVGDFKGRCLNPDGVVVVEGTFRQMMLKKYFDVAGEEKNDKS